MKLVLSREQCEAFDRSRITEALVPSLVLMENAGRGAADLLLTHFGGRKHSVLVVAGPGNNGGDGFVVARRLLAKGHEVSLVLLAESTRLTGDAKVMHDAYVGIGGKVQALILSQEILLLDAALAGADVVVDAIFGTGLARNITGLFAQVIERINAAPAMRFALDLPTGLDADKGVALGLALKADVTATFGHEKPGLFTTAGVEHAGQCELIDIGVPALTPDESKHFAERFESIDLAGLLAARSRASHKGRSGRVGILAGHVGTIGAAILSARGALRMGAGLVTHLGLPETISAIEPRVLEAMTRRLDPHHIASSLADAIHGMDSLVVGPGFGLGAAQTEMVEYVVEQCPCPVVLDADALTLISGNLRRFRLAKGPRILLPHRGEVARLLQISVADVERDPFNALAMLTDLTHAVVVMKGAYTFIGVPGKKPAILGEPCSAMATGGAGDVLSGVVSALLVSHDPFASALLGVHLHSRAGALWAAECGADRGLLASELADWLPKAVAELSQAKALLPD